MTNRMQLCRIICCSLAALLHVSSDIFTHRQEHLNCIYSLWYYTCVVVAGCCHGRVGTDVSSRGSRGIALLFHDHDTRRSWVVSVTPRLLFTSVKDPVPIVQEAGWAPGPVCTSAENLAPTGNRSPYCPARSQSPCYKWVKQIVFTGVVLIP
jgi:hypothetical protein